MKLSGILRRRLRCAFCGDLIAIYGNRRLTDGVLCRDCAGRLSPRTKNRRMSASDAAEHLAYRKENERMAERFTPSRTLGLKTKVLIDDTLGCFLVASCEDWRKESPDILPLTCVKDCRMKTEEHRTELTYRNKEGKKVGYVPKRYEYSYDYRMTIRVDRPGFDTVSFRLNSRSVDGKAVRDRDSFGRLGEEICAALMQERDRPPKPMNPQEEFEDLLLSFEGLTEEDNGRPKPE